MPNHAIYKNVNLEYILYVVQKITTSQAKFSALDATLQGVASHNKEIFTIIKFQNCHRHACFLQGWHLLFLEIRVLFSFLSHLLKLMLFFFCV